MNPLREQIRSMLHVEPTAGGYRARLDVGADLMILTDHFPTQPILPGICMVQAILLAGAVGEGAGELRLRLLKNAKMMQPVAPGDQVIIDAQVSPTNEGDFIIKAKLSVASQKRAEFSLVARKGER